MSCGTTVSASGITRQAGAVIVGDTGVFRVDTFPFGGVKGSGLGREGVRWAMESMTEPRMLVLSLRDHA